MTMLKLKVNDKDIEIEEGLTVLQACELAEWKYRDFVIMKNCQSQEIVECV